MEFVNATERTKDYRKMKKLYKQAFPSNERAPFRLLKRRAKSDNADFWALYNEDKFIGITYIVKNKDLAYIFYLAVQPDERGKGYGTEIINELKKRYAGMRLFLALELPDEQAPNYEQRVKRHEFYSKCGLNDLPCKIKEASVIYGVMGIGGNIKPEEYGEMMKLYLGGFLSKIIDVRLIE